MQLKTIDHELEIKQLGIEADKIKLQELEKTYEKKEKLFQDIEAKISELRNQ